MCCGGVVSYVKRGVDGAGGGGDGKHGGRRGCLSAGGGVRAGTMVGMKIHSALLNFSTIETSIKLMGRVLRPVPNAALVIPLRISDVYFVMTPTCGVSLVSTTGGIPGDFFFVFPARVC